MTVHVVALLLVGVGLLIVGAEATVRGASRLAAAAGISPLVTGLTVVAFGTSSPELAINIRAGLAGAPDIALGNAVGSNIFNILFILGISAIVAPLVVAPRLVRLDVPLMIAASVLLFVLALDGRIGRLDGFVLLAGVIGYIVLVVRLSLRESPAVRAEYARKFGERPQRAAQWFTNVALVVAGLAMLTAGAHWLVSGSVALAHALGLSELVIGLTIVAAGTSLPEAATSVIASIRGERDIAVGNVVGSSLFNILAVVGLASVVAPEGITVAPAALRFDIPVMIAVSVACLPVFFSGYRIARWEGALFLAFFAAYMVYLVLNAEHHDALSAFSTVMKFFVLPIVALTLVVLTMRAWRSRGAG